jgi:hypothetical protein
MPVLVNEARLPLGSSMRRDQIVRTERLHLVAVGVSVAFLFRAHRLRLYAGRGPALRQGEHADDPCFAG